MQKSRKKISRLNKQDQKQKEGSRRWDSENWGLGPLQEASSAGPKWTYHFSASSVSPSQPPQTGFRERISCPPSPAASAGRGPKVRRLESGSSSSTSFPRSLHETETRSAAADQHSRREEDSKAQLVSSPWPCPLQATPSEMARLLPPPRGVTYAGEAGPPGRKNNSPRGRAYLAEGGGAQGTGGRGAAVPPTGPWRSSHTPHLGEVRQSVRDLQAAPPQSFGGGGPTLCCRRAVNSTHQPGGCGGDACCLPLPGGVGPEKAEKESRETGSLEGPGIAVWTGLSEVSLPARPPRGAAGGVGGWRGVRCGTKKKNDCGPQRLRLRFGERWWGLSKVL